MTLTRSHFAKALRSHDWYYGYSDDGNVWRRGYNQSMNLAVQHADLKCPWPMRQLRLWSYRAILEDFVEVAPGEFYRDPTRTKFIAATRRDDLLTRAEYDEITEWMTLGATAEEIAVIA